MYATIHKCENIKKLCTSIQLHRTLEERLTAFYGISIDEIEKLPHESEIDWGISKGAELI